MNLDTLVAVQFDNTDWKMLSALLDQSSSFERSSQENMARIANSYMIWQIKEERYVRYAMILRYLSRGTLP